MNTTNTKTTETMEVLKAAQAPEAKGDPLVTGTGMRRMIQEYAGGKNVCVGPVGVMKADKG